MISTSALLQKLGIDQRPMWLGEEDPRGNKYGRGGYHEHKYRKAGYPENKYKRACYGGVICTIVVLFLVLSVRNTSDILESLGPWTYDSTRDANNYALTAEQCDSAFPDLYKPIHEIFTNLGRDIELNDTIGSIHWGEGRAMLYDNQLYNLENYVDGIADYRRTGTLLSLNRAIIGGAATGRRFPNIEFSMASQDSNADRSRPNWAYGRMKEDNLTVLIPEFGFYAEAFGKIGSWRQVQRKMREASDVTPFPEKIPQLIWRGTVDFNPTVRGNLVNASLGKPWSNVEKGSGDNRIMIEEHCNYQFAAHTEGLAYSGRLKYLHNCESVLLIHEFAWETHDQHLLISSGPDQNYVQCKRDWSDLDEKMDWLLSHPEDAARIARNNVKQFRDRYLTPAAEACYWRKLVEEWGRHSFEPEFYKEVNGTKEMRGTPFENFVLLPAQNHILGITKWKTDPNI